MTYNILIAVKGRSQQYADLLAPQVEDARLIVCNTGPDILARLPEADIVLMTHIPDHYWQHARRVTWVQSPWAGVDQLRDAPLPEGCVLCRAEGIFSARMSDYSMAHILAHSVQLPRMYANHAAGRWEHFVFDKLERKRLGVAGTGSIGAEIARKGRALGMEVWSLVRSARTVSDADRVFTPEQVAEFTAGVDYLVSTLPNTPETIGLIDPRRMKAGSLLINVGRGITISEEAILDSVRSGCIQAVLDVFMQEPLPPEHPFWSTPGITVTPHLSGLSLPAEAAAFFAANFRRFVAGQPLLGVVDRKRGY